MVQKKKLVESFVMEYFNKIVLKTDEEERTARGGPPGPKARLIWDGSRSKGYSAIWK